jgi:hypothetical protein
MRKPAPPPVGFIPPDIDPDEGMIREGSPQGGPSVRFDPIERANYHLNADGSRKYHGVPEGFAFDDSGFLQPVTTEQEHGI